MKEAFFMRLVSQKVNVNAVRRPPLPIPEHIEAGVKENTEKIGAELRADPEAADVSVELQKGLMDGIFSILAMSEHAESCAQEGTLVACINLVKSALVALPAPLNNALFL
jgi:hypothetical protein